MEEGRRQAGHQPASRGASPLHREYTCLQDGTLKDKPCTSGVPACAHTTGWRERWSTIPVHGARAGHGAQQARHTHVCCTAHTHKAPGHTPGVVGLAQGTLAERLGEHLQLDGAVLLPTHQPQLGAAAPGCAQGRCRLLRPGEPPAQTPRGGLAAATAGAGAGVAGAGAAAAANATAGVLRAGPSWLLRRLERSGVGDLSAGLERGPEAAAAAPVGGAIGTLRIEALLVACLLHSKQSTRSMTQCALVACTVRGTCRATRADNLRMGEPSQPPAPGRSPAAPAGALRAPGPPPPAYLSAAPPAPPSGQQCRPAGAWPPAGAADAPGVPPPNLGGGQGRQRQVQARSRCLGRRWRGHERGPGRRPPLGLLLPSSAAAVGSAAALKLRSCPRFTMPRPSSSSSASLWSYSHWPPTLELLPQGRSRADM